MVGWEAVYLRGFPLLVRGDRAKPGFVALWAADGAIAQWRATEIRRAGQTYRPLQLVAAQPAVPAGAGRRRSAVHLLPFPLSEAVPPEICRQGGAAQPD